MSCNDLSWSPSWVSFPHVGVCFSWARSLLLVGRSLNPLPQRHKPLRFPRQFWHAPSCARALLATPRTLTTARTCLFFKRMATKVKPSWQIAWPLKREPRTFLTTSCACKRVTTTLAVFCISRLDTTRPAEHVGSAHGRRCEYASSWRPSSVCALTIAHKPHHTHSPTVWLHAARTATVHRKVLALLTDKLQLGQARCGRVHLGTTTPPRRQLHAAIQTKV